MDTIFVLVIIFFGQNGVLQGGAVRFPSPQACAAGAVQAEKDFFPTKIDTVCVPIQVPAETPKVEKPKSKTRDA